MVAYTERVVRVFASFLFSANEELLLWYVPPDVIKIARQLGMAMEISLASCANVHEFLELLYLIESIQFSSLQDTRRERTYREINNHPGPIDEGAHFVF